MERQPVVVVGASSAGLFAAGLLAQEGVPVCVYEQSPRLAPAARTLIVTPELVRVLGFVPEEAILNRVHTLELCANGTSVRVTLQEPDLVVERAELLRILARRAERAGAQIKCGYRFEGLETESRRTMALFRERERQQIQSVPVQVVLAADGAHSDVARSIGKNHSPKVTVLQAQVALPPAADPGVARVWFAPLCTSYFFWLVPETARSAVIGIVDDSPRRARTELDRFIQEQGLEPLGFQSALIPMYHPGLNPIEHLGHTDILMVGDAARQVKVTTVGGTVTGLQGARAAVSAVVHGSDYRRELRGVNRELLLHWRIRNVMSRLREREYEALLLPLKGQVGRLLQTHNRDSLAGAVWSIVAAHPRLLLLAARAFLKQGLDQ